MAARKKQLPTKKPIDSDPPVDQGPDVVLRQNGYIPATEVAERLGVSLQTVARWSDDGKVDFEIMKHRRWVLVSSLIEHLGETKSRMFGFLPKADVKKRGRKSNEFSASE